MRTVLAIIARFPLPAAMGLFAIVTVLVISHLSVGIDQWAYQAVQSLGGQTADAVASAVTLLGRTDIAVGLALVTAVVLLWQRQRILTMAPLAIVTLPLMLDALKSGVARHRPPAGSGHDLQLIPSLLPKEGVTFSFPSSHAAFAAFLAVIIGYAAPRWRLPLWMLAIAVAFSRLYLDKHWVSDIAAGLLLGFIVGHVAWRIARGMSRRYGS